MTSPTETAAAAPVAAATRPVRYRELDGLRGVGALVVVFCHVLVVLPLFADLLPGNPDGGDNPSAFSAQWWLYRTPLRALWAGHEAVLLFFILSGFVLCLPLLRAAQHNWRSYYARRLVRLYLPVWGALVLALVVASLIPREPGQGSVWMQAHKDVGAGRVLLDAFLLLGTSNLNSPLWSLRWEIIFSMVLPLAFFALRWMSVYRWWKSAAALCVVASTAGTMPEVRAALPQAWLSVGLLEYMPVFAVGMVLAFRVHHGPPLRLHPKRLAPSRGGGWLAVAVAVTAACSPSYFSSTAPAVVAWVANAVSLVGVGAVVVLASRVHGLRSWLDSRPLQWLGQRSFSLYLVHEPLVVAVALLVQPDSALVWLGVAAALLVPIFLTTEGFYRSVERPAHRLASRAGRVFTPKSQNGS